MKMNKLRNFVFFAVVTTSSVFFSSCDSSNGEEVISKKTGVLIVNAGNFGQGNGSVSFYDEELKTILNNVIKNANNGSEIGALIESIYQNDGIGYLVCNGTDKIEFFGIEDYTYLANPVTNISQPRYMTVVGDKAYITCWGPWSSNFTLDESYVAVMDLESKKIIDSLDCGSGPEGIVAVNNKLYIANSYETTLTVINLNDDSGETINLQSAPQHFIVDGSGLLWVSVASSFGTYPEDKVGLQSINTNTNVLGSFIKVPGMSDDGLMTMDGDNNIYLLTAQPWPETDTEVFVFDTNTKTLDSDALITGENFNGIGYNTTTDKLYIADAAGFAGNGKIMVFNAEGLSLDNQVTSVGPFHFMFK